MGRDCYGPSLLWAEMSRILLFEHNFNCTFWQPLLAMLVKTKSENIMQWIFCYEEKICGNSHQRRQVKLYNCKNLQKICVKLQSHRPFYYVNGQFNWGAISCNNIIST